MDVLGRRCGASTTEYDDDGTIHRTLSPAMRAAVLAVTPLVGDVDTQHVYPTTTDGSDLTDVYGPLHVVQLANGTPGSYRQHTHNFYGTGTHVHLVTDTIARSLSLLDGQRAPHRFCSEREHRPRLPARALGGSVTSLLRVPRQAAAGSSGW